MKAILDRLEKTHGKVRTLPDRSPLEQLLYLILQEGWDSSEAMQALDLLQTTFLEWNELRVALPGEVVSVLRPLAPPDGMLRARRMLAFLEMIFKARNKLDLDYILEWDHDKRADYIAKMPMVSPSVAQAFLQQLAGSATLLVSAEALRVGGRIGIIPKTTSLNTARKALEPLLKDTDWPRFQLLFTIHAEKICQAKVWYCSDCVINALCKSAKVDGKKVKSGAS